MLKFRNPTLAASDGGHEAVLPALDALRSVEQAGGIVVTRALEYIGRVEAGGGVMWKSDKRETNEWRGTLSR